jgi:hypothetical protein
MNDEQPSESPAQDDTAHRRADIRGRDMGIGTGFLVAAFGMLANNLGLTQMDWFLPAILIGYGAYYLTSALMSR